MTKLKEEFKEMNRKCAEVYGCGEFPPEVFRFIEKDREDLLKKIEEMKIESLEEFEERSGFKSETCGTDMIYNLALEDIKKLIEI